MAESLTIGFLGAGKMATALAKGFLRSGLITPDRLAASDAIPAAAAAFAAETGAAVSGANRDVLQRARVIVLAVKPGQVAGVLAELRGDFTPDYFGPVDFAALYWHIVDLIWIFLFPLLYII